jgi:hypothetical protein
VSDPPAADGPVIDPHGHPDAHVFEVQVAFITETEEELERASDAIGGYLCGYITTGHAICRLSVASPPVFREERGLYHFEGDYWFMDNAEATQTAADAVARLNALGFLARLISVKESPLDPPYICETTT